MRKYPKKCPKCGSYMEPIFEEPISQFGMNNFEDRSPYQEPKDWKCVDC